MPSPPSDTAASSPRRATIADLAAVETLVRDAYQEYVPLIGREPGPMLDDYATLIGREQVHVVDQADRLAALLVLIPQDDALLLDNVAVAPAAREMGLGRALLTYAERVAAEAGYRRIRLYTHQAMTRNIATYTRHGYVETHRGVQDGLARVFMMKALGPNRTADAAATRQDE